jgi:hypothetical protein
MSNRNIAIQCLGCGWTLTIHDPEAADLTKLVMHAKKRALCDEGDNRFTVIWLEAE